MYTVKLMNEYLHGPIWVYNSDGIAVRNFPLVYNDPILETLNKKAMEMFSSYYEFDSHDMPCWFDKDKEKREKQQMADIIRQILNRLKEINDGSFVVEDYETERLNSL